MQFLFILRSWNLSVIQNCLCPKMNSLAAWNFLQHPRILLTDMVLNLYQNNSTTKTSTDVAVPVVKMTNAPMVVSKVTCFACTWECVSHTSFFGQCTSIHRSIKPFSSMARILKGNKDNWTKNAVNLVVLRFFSLKFWIHILCFWGKDFQKWKQLRFRIDSLSTKR